MRTGQACGRAASSALTAGATQSTTGSHNISPHAKDAHIKPNELICYSLNLRVKEIVWLLRIFFFRNSVRRLQPVHCIQPFQLLHSNSFTLLFPFNFQRFDINFIGAHHWGRIRATTKLSWNTNSRLLCRLTTEDLLRGLRPITHRTHSTCWSVNNWILWH